MSAVPSKRSGVNGTDECAPTTNRRLARAGHLTMAGRLARTYDGIRAVEVAATAMVV